MAAVRQHAEIKRWFWKRRSFADRLRIAFWQVRQDGVWSLRSGLFKRSEQLPLSVANDPRFAFLNDPRTDIETSRLRLTTFDISDLERLVGLFEPDAGRDSTQPRYWTVEYILAHELLAGYQTWVINLRTTGECIGHCSLTEMRIDGVVEQEIGYRVGERHRGHGYATDAATAVREFLFQRGVTRVISTIATDNTASQRVAVKNGMHWEKQIEKHGRPVEIYAAVRDAD